MLTFEPDTHTYRWNGAKRPSVTQVMRAGGLIDERWFNDAAAWRGSVVHKCCELDDKGTLNEASVDPMAAGYLEGWRKWKRNFGWSAIAVEKFKYHPHLQYCGTPDRVMRGNDGYLCIVDIKTGVPSKAAAIQTAGYCGFLDIPSYVKRYAIQLMPEGDYVVTEYPTSSFSIDWAAFNSCLNINNWRRINGY
ncbi:MAG: hypothetical protein EBR82_22520 [Caulobacteraceae bacterium]|nr:hypothetical protein [Caulobacteraceae bacterium]